MPTTDPRLTEALRDLGWRDFFAAQLSPTEAGHLCPVRVMAVHRGQLAVAGAGDWAGDEAGSSGAFARTIPPHVPHAQGPEDHATVGDWLLIAPDTGQIVRILRRASLFKRLAAGSARKLQLIAANVDTLFIVASCNQDFSVARLERYLVLAREAGVAPVIVLTKADLATDTEGYAPESYAARARALQPDLPVHMVNARDPHSVATLAAYCGRGETVALLGSSGVGKSTMINTLRGSSSIATQPVREGDGTGRHTTTVREMHALNNGGWLVDTPGMRELQLSDAAEGLAEVFDDIVTTALACRFTNCSHEGEPDCAIQARLADGTLDLARLERWRKLTAQDAANAPGWAGRRHQRPPARP